MSEDWWTHIDVIKEKYLWSNLNQRERISFKLLKFHGQYIYHGEDLVSRFSIHLPSFDVLDSLFSGFLERYINTISGNSQGNKSSKFQFLYFFWPWRPAGVIHTLLVYTVFYNMRNNIVHSFGHASPTWWSFQSNWISASPPLPKKGAYPPNMCVNK